MSKCTVRENNISALKKEKERHLSLTRKELLQKNKQRRLRAITLQGVIEKSRILEVNNMRVQKLISILGAPIIFSQIVMYMSLVSLSMKSRK